jgi:hypothetical protein
VANLFLVEERILSLKLVGSVDRKATLLKLSVLIKSGYNSRNIKVC